MTTKEIADAWIDNHRPREWKQLLAACRQAPVLPDEVRSWLAKFVPGFTDKMWAEPIHDDSVRERASARFEQAFLAQVSAAVEHPG